MRVIMGRATAVNKKLNKTSVEHQYQIGKFSSLCCYCTAREQARELTVNRVSANAT